MLLEQLREYHRRLEPTPTMYGPSPVRWLIDLDPQGNFQGMVPMEGEGRRAPRGKVLLIPQVSRTSTVRANLLVDNAKYALGVPGDKTQRARERAAKAHRAFIALARECAEETREPAVHAVVACLERPAPPSLPPDIGPGDIVMFRVDGAMPTDLRSVQAFWARRQAAATAASARGETVDCLICGQRRPPATRHPVKIKGIPGGQSSGTALVSANMPAFESYGLEASRTAPICQGCAEEYAKGANQLIRDGRTRLVIGPVMYLFWTREASTDLSISSLLQDPQPEDVQALLRTPWTSQAGATKVEATAFYATALAASMGRVAVREWLEMTVGEAREHLVQYFALQRIVRPDGSNWRPIGLFPLAASVVPPGSDIPAVISTGLLRLAIAGASPPQALLTGALRRARMCGRAERPVTYPRAAVIKMVLQSREREGPTMEELDPKLRHPAYLCGRIFAIVEAVQYAALGQVGTTVTDRYFGAASTTPAYVLGKLVSDSRKAHFGKLRRQKPAAYYALDQRLSEAMDGLGEFPETLTLEEQGRFVLGYYHQRAADRKAARARRELGDLVPGQEQEEAPPGGGEQ